MYETNIYLTKEDKTKLLKTARKKMLSLSTFVDIIIQNYYIIAHKNCFQQYIVKGSEQTHIKLKNKNKNTLTPMIVTNCVTLYLHKEYNTKQWTTLIDYEKLNRKIQSQADKTYDNRYLYNEIKRAMYKEERHTK